VLGGELFSPDRDVAKAAIDNVCHAMIVYTLIRSHVAVGAINIQSVLVG
jgi:hypothetical protein